MHGYAAGSPTPEEEEVRLVARITLATILAVPACAVAGFAAAASLREVGNPPSAALRAPRTRGGPARGEPSAGPAPPHAHGAPTQGRRSSPILLQGALGP